MKAVNSTSNQELACKLSVAGSIPQRMIGLLGRKSLACDEGLWIKHCKGIHPFGMKFLIDVVFLSIEYAVIGVRQDVQPNRITGVYARAASVLELPAGKVRETATKTGDTITFL